MNLEQFKKAFESDALKARQYIGSLRTEDLEIIIRDMTDAEHEVTKGRTLSMGDPRIDSPTWLAFREEIKQILKSRRAQE